MKKILTITLFIYSILTCSAQGNTTQTVQKFTELKVYDRITVTLIKSDENKLIVSGEDKDDIKLLENNGVLKLRMDLNEFLLGNTVDVKLYYTESLTIIDANENAKITSEGIIKGAMLEIKAQEAGIISLNLDVDTITVKSTTGSEITLTGTTRLQDASIHTGGKLYNKRLMTKETIITVLAGGHAEVHATEKVVAKVKAGGSIVVTGNPKIVDKDDTFGGKIEINK